MEHLHQGRSEPVARPAWTDHTDAMLRTRARDAATATEPGRFAGVARIRNAVTGHVRERVPGTDIWTLGGGVRDLAATVDLEAMPEMVAADLSAEQRVAAADLSVEQRVAAELDDLQQRYEHLTETRSAHTLAADRAQLAAALAVLFARRAGWWRVLARHVYGPGDVALVYGRAVLTAAATARTDAQFWRDQSATWRRHADQPTNPEGT
jgi:hypothetical protein